MFFLERLSRLDADDYTGWRRSGVRLLQFVLALGEQFGADKVVIRASGLAYASLLATVPLIAVLFALFTAFASFGDLRVRVEEFLFSQLLPTRQDEFIAYINQFTENTSKLGFIGFIFLIITAIMLLDNVETNFNAIWHVTTSRKIINKITAYTSVLVFGTIFLGASLSISARLKALIFTGRVLDLGLISQVTSWLLPLLLSVLAFLLMYLVIPFTKVHFKSAAVGALVAGVLWESGKNLFANSVGQSVKYSTIYGSLAVIPIFLIWIYITWVVVLLGLEITFTHQHFTSLIRRRLYRETSTRERISLVVKVYALIARRFHDGGSPPTAAELAEHFEVPRRVMEENLIAHLVAGDLVQRVDGENQSGGLVPTRSLDQVRAVDLLRAVLGTPDAHLCSGSPPEDRVDALLAAFQCAGEQAIGGTTARDLVDAAADEPESSVVP